MADENKTKIEQFFQTIEDRYKSGTLHPKIDIDTIRRIKERLDSIKSLKNNAKTRKERRKNRGEQSSPRSLFGIVGQVSNLVKTTASGVSGMARAIAGTALTTTTNIGSAVINSTNSIVGTAGNMASGIITSTSNLVSQSATNATNAIGDLTKSTGHVATDVVTGVLSETASTLTGVASNVANQIINKAKETAASIGSQEDVQKIGQEMVETCNENALNADSLAEKYDYMEQDDFDKDDFGYEEMMDVIDDTQNMVDNMIENTCDMFSDDTMDEFGQLLGDVDQATNEYCGSEEVIGASDEIADAYMDFSEDFGSDMLDEIENLSNELMDEGFDINSDEDLNMDNYGEPEDLSDAIDEMAEDMSNDFIDDASDMASSIQDSMDSELDELQDNNAEQTQQVLDNIDQMVNEVDDILSELDDKQQKIDDLVENGIDDDTVFIDDEDNDDNDDEDEDEYNDEEQNDQESQMKEQTPANPPQNKDDSTNSSKDSGNSSYGWDGHDIEFVSGALGMMHDGDQQLFNPYGHPVGKWTLYSFRPSDTMTKKTYPQIAITPASFEALSSMRTMLDQIPYVVIKEYFFKNTASTMISLIQKLMEQTPEKKSPPTPDTDKSSAGAPSAKSTGNGLMSKIKEAFETISMEDQVINIPYILYCGLRKKLYGNTYVFPYLATSSTIINQSSNLSEWNGEENFVFKKVDAAANALGQVLSAVTGSMAKGVKKVFPAPTWGGPGSDKIEFHFDLMLINDHIIRSRNNYMCVNTIINNNRNMQKAILDFPGALYELWLPTGQRHLMCTGDFKLYPLGLNRKTPSGFFTGGGKSGANFSIGTSTGNGSIIKNPHKDEVEVLPDGYKLECKFQSCLPNNLNSSIFQYYVKMTGYDDDGALPPGGSTKDDLLSKVGDMVQDWTSKFKKDEESEQDVKSPRSMQTYERTTFIESTYNKKLQKLRTQFGDQTIDSDSAVQVVRDSISIVNQSREFLFKLYGSNDGNLWYRENPTDEYYTTLKPDDTQWLKTQYGDGIRNLREVQIKLEDASKSQRILTDKLGVMSLGLDERQRLMDDVVKFKTDIVELNTRKDQIVEDLMVIDNQILSRAYDEQDRDVSIAKRKLTSNIFNRIWGERIMNSYEQDKVQFMTSKEKERYFKEKVLELKKWDRNGILDNRDWFLRVVVIDFIVSEMIRLIDVFKSCPYDDFETIYKIVRKLNLLKIDHNLAITERIFIVNKTNLFKIPEEELKKFDKIDQLLGGKGSLYDLFQSQLGFSNEQEPIVIKQDMEIDDDKEPELVFEQKSEEQASTNKNLRDNIVRQIWGSEERLTRLAYEEILKKQDEQFVHSDYDDSRLLEFNTIREMKERIIQLKLNGDNTSGEEIQSLLSAFYSLVTAMKEKMVLLETQRITQQANSEVEDFDNTVNAPIG